MKGIAHFALGIAVVSCLPPAVRAGVDGNPWYFLLGGIFGLLPDTLDFKVARFFFRHDIEVIPDPLKPDPRMIAGAVAEAANRAHATGRPVRIKLHTVRLGTNAWRPFDVHFDVRAQNIVVREDLARAVAPVTCPLRLDYLAENRVDILEGPVFTMEPTADGQVVPRFIPWHRQWSHSLVVALLMGLTGITIGGWLAGLVILLGVGTHILADQLGFMGSNLFWPFTRRRMPGAMHIRSTAALPNFLAVWGSCLLVFWNLSTHTPGVDLPIPALRLLLPGLGIPIAVAAILRRIGVR